MSPGTGEFNGIRFMVQGNYWMRLSPAGYLGIGTDSPESRLDVRGADVEVSIHGSSDLPGIQLFDSNENRKWAIASRGLDSDNLYFSASPTDTNGSAIAAAAKVTIQQNGNVGIGTTNPSGILDVNHASGELRLRLDQDETSDPYGLGMSTTVGRKFFVTSEQGSYRQALGFGDAADSSDIIFGISSSSDGGSNWNSRFAVSHNGNVGIGTADPQQRLHVNGVIRADTRFDLGTATGASGNYTVVNSVSHTPAALNYSTQTETLVHDVTGIDPSDVYKDSYTWVSSVWLTSSGGVSTGTVTLKYNGGLFVGT